MTDQMSLRALENMILRLKKSGAVFIRVGSVEVSFAVGAKPVGFEIQDQVGERLEMMMDEEEEATIEKTARKREALKKLMYSHS